MLCDIRDEAQVIAAIEKTVAEFGGIDICVNNASAISLTGTQMTDMKRYDLMHGHQHPRHVPGVEILHSASEEGGQSAHPDAVAAARHEGQMVRASTAYTMAKFGMSMCVLGLSGELKSAGVAVNALWPRTTIATAAIGNLLGGDAMMRASRTPEIMGDAAYVIFTKPTREFTGKFCIDDKVLYASGVRDFEHYRVDPNGRPDVGFFVPDDDVPPPGVTVQALPSVGARSRRARKPTGAERRVGSRRWIAVGLLLAASAAACVIFRPDRAIRVATAVVAHNVCSKTFVSGLDPQTVFSETIDRDGLRRLRWLFDSRSIAPRGPSMHRRWNVRQPRRRFTKGSAAS